MKRWLVSGVIFSVIVLAGCGGGGKSGSATLSGSTRASVLLTDSFREDFGHVWATIYHVELVPSDGSAPVVLFDDSAGHQIDLKTLRDASGARYSFLGSTTIPSGTYKAINITIGSTMQLFKSGVATGDPIPVASTIPTDSNGHPVLTLTFKTAKTLTSSNNTLIIDFDLARFVLRKSDVIPAIAEGDGAGANDPSKHEQGQYVGIVSNLTGAAPTLTFTLTSPRGQTTTVVTTASTAIYGQSSLADGSRVRVAGTLDTTTQNLVATQIDLCGSSEDLNKPMLMGTASNIDATAGTFDVTVRVARGFMPGTTTAKVVTNASTVFYTDAGATQSSADFFAALAATPTVAVKGTYDSSTNTLTATSAKINDRSKDGGWEKDQHNFRNGADRWGNGHFKGKN